MNQTSRRTFLSVTGALFGAALMTRIAPGQNSSGKPRLRKAFKFGAIRFGSSYEEKLAALKSLGFEGIEVDSPSEIDREALLTACRATGIAIHGVIDSVHWKDTLSDPDPAVRARGVDALQHALRDAKFYGADTVLLVPGKVTDTVSFDDVWSRSQAEVRKAIPLASELGVKIAIEVVWNNFITTPEQLVRYVDELDSPAVGAYFDISNMIKYGVPSADWIRALGHRMLKFDFKGYSKEHGWVKIGDGDEDWPEVLKALGEVNYSGWATAEVPAKDLAELTDISERIDRCFAS